MSRYFHCNEWDTVISIDTVRSEFEGLQAEGYYTDYTFDEYLSGCMWWNNGELTPLSDYIDILKHRLRTAMHYAHTDPRNREDYDEDIADLTAQIADLQRYERS